MPLRSLFVHAAILAGIITVSARPGEGRPGPANPRDLGASPLDLGEAGIAWYPKLEDGLAEAKRTNRPIFFMAVASQCNGVPGVF